MAKKTDFSYFSLYLKSLLDDIGDGRSDNEEYISEQAAKAEAEYEECRRSGMNESASEERAISVLTSEIRG